MKEAKKTSSQNSMILSSTKPPKLAKLKNQAKMT